MITPLRHLHEPPSQQSQFGSLSFWKHGSWKENWIQSENIYSMRFNTGIHPRSWTAHFSAYSIGPRRPKFWSMDPFWYGLESNKFVASCPPTQTPTQMLKRWFSIFSTQGIGSSLVSFQIIFEALQSELVIFDFYLMRSKLQKIPEFNLSIRT